MVICLHVLFLKLDNKFQRNLVLQIRGSHSSDYVIYWLMKYNAIKSGIREPMFWKNPLPPSSR